MKLKIRIPSWAKNVRLDGKPARVRNGHIVVKRRWNGCITLTLDMDAQAHFTNRPTGLRTVEYGPLVFALPIKAEYRMREFTRDNVERKFPYCDYELIPKSAWNYGFADKSLLVEECPVDTIPFSSVNSPLVIRTQLAPVDWAWADGYDTVPAIAPVNNFASGDKQEMLLIPYGCAKLRMTEMPRLKIQKR